MLGVGKDVPQALGGRRTRKEREQRAYRKKSFRYRVGPPLSFSWLMRGARATLFSSVWVAARLFRYPDQHAGTIENLAQSVDGKSLIARRHFVERIAKNQEMRGRDFACAP
jgi:hypothetical protein